MSGCPYLWHKMCHASVPLGSRTKVLAQYRSHIVPFFEWFWTEAEGPRQILLSAESLVPSRKQNLHCGVAAADNWRILAKLRCFNNRWWRSGFSFLPPVRRTPPCAMLCCLPRAVIAQPCAVPSLGHVWGPLQGSKGHESDPLWFHAP